MVFFMESQCVVNSMISAYKEKCLAHLLTVSQDDAVFLSIYLKYILIKFCNFSHIESTP